MDRNKFCKKNLEENMKKTLILAIAAISTLAFSGCSKKAETKQVANDEKKLIICGSNTEAMVTAMVSVFEQETGIKVEYLSMGTGEALKRIETEINNPQVDVMWGGSLSTVKMKKDLFANYTCANESSFFAEYKNVDGNITRFSSIPSVIMVNTDLVGNITVEGYEDLLNPALKGKIAFADPQLSSSSFEHLVNMLYAMGKGNPDNGWDYVRKFIKQLDGKLLGSSSAVYKGVADGEYTVGPTFEQGAVQYAVAGSPVAIKYMKEGVIFRCDGVYIVKNCPHLESARAFVDWATSKQAQTILSESQNRRSIRKDVPSPSNMESMFNINVITDDEDYSSAHKAEWIAKFKDIYTE